MPVASRDVYTDITAGLFLLQLPHESQLLASASSSSPLTQSNLALVPPASPLYIESTTVLNTDTLPPHQGARTGPI
ncbi:hypothetical protein N7494_013307 [Penicillium frequentans]|uniref:Uncharacterized protein n=1 Tax=Penicillium frequentans TaxID=3151616 RepID=A0AAD6CHV1_9EURO|nr:hypothetical protein N7494_013307 [Penicillium glabrum]